MSSSPAASAARSAAAAVGRLYTMHPFAINSVIGYSVFASGDFLAQQFDPHVTKWDARRSLSIGFLGVWQNGILLNLWYRTLDRVVGPKTDLFSVLKKIACDEAVFAPQLACSYLACSAYISSPGDWGKVQNNVQTKFFETWSNDLKLWPCANLIGFTFIPRHIRPTYASAIQLGWQMYLSTMGFERAPNCDHPEEHPHGREVIGRD